MKKKYISKFFVLLLICLPQFLFSQYFGRNKVNYEDFDFKIYETPHFEIYHYIDNKEALESFAQLAERWYKRHQAVFLDTIKKNPIILYNNHADFQQTTVIQGVIGVGTGGVTEGFRNRVVMPISASNSETSHVLGHEMIHVFQYNLIKKSDSLSLQSLRNLPMWMVEGLPEYMSIGKNSPHTAMWMRDAVQTDDIPTFKDLTRKPNKYFPYRYGHAVWAYLTALHGDAIIRPLLSLTAKYGYKRAFDSLFHIKPDSLSTLWANSLKDAYEPYLDKTEDPPGTAMFNKENAGKLNLAPSISPSGKYMAFLSDKEVISAGIFVADLEKGEIIKKLTDKIRDSHIDNYSYLESAGSWSPDGKKYALTTFSQGRNKLLIIDVKDLKAIKTIEIPGIQSFTNPSWSPGGNRILITALDKGYSDLFVYSLETKQVEKITDDKYSDLHPEWSPDGNEIVFISDRGTETNFRELKFSNYRLCLHDLNKDETQVLNMFPDVDNTSPQFSADGSSIYFLSNANGFRNLYEYSINEEEVYKLTDIFTGISGITELAPALSVARKSGDIAYTVYHDDGYVIYKANPNDFKRRKANPYLVDLEPSELPPIHRDPPINVVNANLKRYPLTDHDKFSMEPYKSRFQLEYVGNMGVGVSFNQMGTSMAGGVTMLFSDMLKRNRLVTSLRVNGEIQDIGGQALYINQANRLHWGGSFSHIPYRSAYFAGVKQDTLNDQLLVNDVIIKERRIFIDELNGFTYYPFNKEKRLEYGANASRYSFRLDSVNNYYAGYTRVEQKEYELETRDPFYVYNTYLAFVSDDSRFALTSPYKGHRYRVQAGKSLGYINYWSALADYRKYFYYKPLSFALRAMHNGRYGKSAGALYPFYMGYHYYVRGYHFRSFDQNRCPGGDCLDVNQLTGSKMALANAEIRYPLSGPKRLALIKSGTFFTDLVGFFDGGLAWNDFDQIKMTFDPEGDHKIPVFSSGMALRLNLFGAAILEGYYAIPYQRDNVDLGVWGLYLSAGGW